MIELEGLESGAESFHDEIIMSLLFYMSLLFRCNYDYYVVCILYYIYELIIMYLFQMTYRIIRFNHRTCHSKCAINWKITMST